MVTFFNSDDVTLEIKNYGDGAEDILVLSVGDEARHELDEMAHADDATFKSDEYYYSMIEYIPTTYGMGIGSLDDFGCLSEAPCIYEYTLSKEGETEVEEVFYYDNYQVRSVTQDLLQYGECVFKKATTIRPKRKENKQNV